MYESDTIKANKIVSLITCWATFKALLASALLSLDLHEHTIWAGGVGLQTWDHTFFGHESTAVRQSQIGSMSIHFPVQKYHGGKPLPLRYFI